MGYFSMRYIVLGFILTFLSVSLVMSNPVLASTPTTLLVITYKNEFTLVLCFVTMTLGTWLSVKLPDDRELSSSMKFVSGLFGGVMAFIYCLHRDKGLTLLNPIWVGVASVCLPATIMILISKVKDFVKSYEVK